MEYGENTNELILVLLNWETTFDKVVRKEKSIRRTEFKTKIDRKTRNGKNNKLE